MLFQLNGTYVVFILSFLAFMALLNQLYLKPVGKTIEGRARLVAAKLEASKNAKIEAQKLLESYESHLLKIRQEAQQLIAQATEEANASRAAELERVAKDGQGKLEMAKAEIAAERAKLIDALVAEESELVETITRKILGDESVNVRVDANEVRRTLEEAC